MHVEYSVDIYERIVDFHYMFLYPDASRNSEDKINVLKIDSYNNDVH